MLALPAGKPLPWKDEWACAMAAARGGEGSFAFLHSSLKTRYSGRYSLLAWNPEKELRSDSLRDAEGLLTQDKPCFANAWFGYLAYELRHELERLPADAPGRLSMPRLHLFRPRHLLVWDHEARALHDVGPEPAPELEPFCPAHTDMPRVAELGSTMRREEYVAAVESLREAIRDGKLYQANLTRKFFGRFAEAPDALALYTSLTRISPSPYGALLRLDGRWVISSSPERFLTMDAAGRVVTRPIKGSRPRAAEPALDAAEALALERSEKDRAENLMIVDLMRNDFARGCVAGSVRVTELCERDSYATVHHLSSAVEGERRGDVSPLAFVRRCFPPGSMTGAPKIAAMRWCTKLENIERGVYSGALGWFGGDGSLDLSVVIRTILLDGASFEFQVGGGIVADSTAGEEWKETLVKARAILQALGLSEEDISF